AGRNWIRGIAPIRARPEGSGPDGCSRLARTTSGNGATVPAGWENRASMDAPRTLVVVADDYGIGPETSRAILELAAEGIVTSTVLMVNSPYAPAAVRAWRAAGSALELGWHPVLTQDPPVAPPSRVPSLIGPDGCLWPLGQFLSRLYTYRLNP